MSLLPFQFHHKLSNYLLFLFQMYRYFRFLIFHVLLLFSSGPSHISKSFLSQDMFFNSLQTIYVALLLGKNRHDQLRRAGPIVMYLSSLGKKRGLRKSAWNCQCVPIISDLGSVVEFEKQDQFFVHDNSQVLFAIKTKPMLFYHDVSIHIHVLSTTWHAVET